ncbi:2-hydroxyacid dehydrogenase [Dyadobacter frigoris]|uniref:2-hydroxyacid dehydrogenase n=1 Tax=Dyadobacter frigoris TaxID=2576211 RepID=A0A4U6CQ56_9BACT|nr:2-hydroxyacid dehydrogenase [Dyadobacter frigoris]TKT86256.1 2-hydroxyacid dehydrogenase [Dyadobacter frigoris]GLU56903.1 lactate dehydrogenase [Dyadobacter frigoris]
MKVVAYSVKTFEKKFLARANQKKHDITLISNALSLATCGFAEGKEAVLVSANDDVSALVINKLADIGIKYIATRSAGTDQIDKKTAELRGIELASVPAYSPTSIAEHAVALAMALNRHLIQADADSHHYNFKLDGLTGFTFSGKTVGIIGLGNTGQAAAAIFNGMGCHVLGSDVFPNDKLERIEQVSLETLLDQSDIISLHLPLTPQTKHMINASSIALMKNGVMLINTSRGALINSADLPDALDQGKIGYLGIDVYEYEKDIFYGENSSSQVKDVLLLKLLAYPNVIITPHQAFLTIEALEEIASQTILSLNHWQDELLVTAASS